MVKFTLQGGEEADIERGDFVNHANWFGDVWAEVLDVFVDGRFKSVTLAGSRTPTEIIHEQLGTDPFFQLRKVHKLGDRFAVGEARILRTREAVHGETKNLHVRSSAELPLRVRALLALPSERVTCESCGQPGFLCDGESRLLAHPVALPCVVPPHRRAVWRHVELDALVCSSCRRGAAQGLKIILHHRR